MKDMPLSERSQVIKEARILQALDHPNIIHFQEVFKTKADKLCIVMEYADGGDLQAVIKAQKGFFSEEVILDWLCQMCLAIKHIHDRKILHRDIKAQNVFVMKDGTVKLGDFGIAKVLNTT